MSKSIDLAWVLRLADSNPGEAVKCLVYYLKLKENDSSMPSVKSTPSTTSTPNNSLPRTKNGREV